jgi:hypothetical protein
MPSELYWTPHEHPHVFDVCLRNRCEALAGVIVCTWNNEICMPRYHWLMCGILFSVFCLKITLHSYLEQTCTKPQHTCCLFTANGNLPSCGNAGNQPVWYENVVCVLFQYHQFVHVIICWNWDLIFGLLRQWWWWWWTETWSSVILYYL